MINRISGWLLIVIVTVGVSFWWLLMAPDRGTAPAKPVHIGELRMLAAILPGRRPTGISYTLLATRKTPGDVYAAGIGLKRRPLAIIAWTLPVMGRRPIMIDPGAPTRDAGVGEFSNFDFARQSWIHAQAKAASLVLYTQGHGQELPARAYQLGKVGMGLARPARTPSPLPIPSIAAQAVAPGVVVIPASSHAPGARLIFVQLADGREFLFTGNISALTENWSRLRARSHLAAVWGPVQARAETYAWLRTIRQLSAEAPNMKIVPGHDYVWLIHQRNGGVISELLPDAAPSQNSAPKIARALRSVRQ